MKSKLSDFDMFMILFFSVMAPIYLLCGCIIITITTDIILGLVVIGISITQFIYVAKMINVYIKEILK